jgi:small subunit ribosomal protein S4e
MHFKRKTIGKFWPIARKGTKYVAVPDHNQYDSLPLVIVVRDMLKIVRTTKELKKLLYEKQIQVNHRLVRETNYPISLFDVVSFPASKKNYRAILAENKKIALEEVSEKDSIHKTYKILNKKILEGKLIQLNLMHGRNIIAKEKANTGDSVVFDLKENKISKIIQLEKGRTAFVIKGKHAGVSGKINEIVERGGKKIAKITIDSEKINVWVENIIVME